MQTSWQDWHGQPCLEVRHEMGSFVIAPERGGKIVSLRDTGGREWLAAPDPETWRLPMATDRFTDSDMCGWDECAPTVLAGEPGDPAYPDHGDLWQRAWRVHHLEEAPAPIVSECRGAWFLFRRSIRPTTTGLRLDYCAIATVTGASPFLWAMHPQLRAPTGSVVLLPEAVTEVVDAMSPSADTLPWTTDLAAIASLAPGGSRKVYAPQRMPVASAVLVHPDGARLVLRWDAVTAPYVGIWMDRGAWAREDVVAIEPSTGWFDSAAVAAERGSCARLASGEALTWWVEVDTVPAPDR